MGAPKGHPYAHPEGVCINGLGPYPAHMGPRFAGPITALRAFKKKNNTRVWGCACAHGRMGASNRAIGRDNLGQKLCDLGVNVRLYVPATCPPNPYPFPPST